MKRKLFKALSLFTGLVLFTQTVFAGDPNIDGGGGEMGYGTNNNGWVIRSQNGGLIYDAEGFRVYLVNSATGVPVSQSVDITNYNVAKSNVYNGRGKTKYEYKYVDSSLSNLDTDYQFARVTTSPKLLPQIIPWGSGNSEARIEAIKEWFLTGSYADWVLLQLETNIDEVKAGGYLIAIEPIAYFRYNSNNYAMTATEVAIFNQIINGGLRNRIGSLSHKNLPLSLFLEHDEFVNSSYRINAWKGSQTTHAVDSDIIKQLGIGYIRYFPDESPNNAESGIMTFSYPADTWVVTSFRLCNVVPAINGWTDGFAITSRNSANAKITIGNTDYNIPNIYIPPGGEQLIWVKWKTPSSPQTLTATARGSSGYLYNKYNNGISDRYASSITADINIFSNDMEKEPPDPTLDDTPETEDYSSLYSKRARDGILHGGGYPKTNSWHVWDCNWQLVGTYTFPRDGADYFDNFYNPYNGIYYEYQFSGSWIRERQYKYQFNKISYRAEIETAYIKLTPDVHCPTAYTKNYKTYMKSGYGVNLETESFIRVTETYERTGSSSTVSYYSPASTSYAAAPQYVFSYFHEFCYGLYNRQLEFVNNKFVFKKNRYSTYNSRVHYTPWWTPDGIEYDVLMKYDHAYTPTGKLAMFGISNAVVIDGVLIDDWRVVKSR